MAQQPDADDAFEDGDAAEGGSEDRDEAQLGADDGEEAELVDAALPDAEDDLPPMDFSTFVVSLRASAMAHMSAASESAEADLPLARQEIDLLGILEEKTRGNLSGEEERLLSQVLFDLRTRYVAARSRAR
jgi:hypothetical protein